MPYVPEKCCCQALGDPTPRACQDDLFCSQCGKSVAWIDSDHLLPTLDEGLFENGTAPVALWVYRSDEPGQGSVYKFSLDFFELDARGSTQPRSLNLVAAECRFEAPGFHLQPEIETAGTSRVVLCLRPLRPGNPPPTQGLRGRLVLIGNCGVPGLVLAGRPGGRAELDVWLFNTPDYLVEVEGRDGAQREPEAQNSWQLWKDGPQELSIRVEPTEAPVFLPHLGDAAAPPVERVADVPVRLIDVPRTGASYRPGVPAVITIGLDPSSWEKQEGRILPLQLDFALGQSCRMNLTFTRQAEGTLVWSTGDNLVLPSMFYGELISTPGESTLLREIVVYNEGVAALRAKVPRVADDLSLLRGVRWIEAGWDDGIEEIDTLVAKVGKKTLRLKIDLSEVHPGNHRAGDPLKAQVIVEHADYSMSWQLNVTIQSVGHRLTLESPLAIDFGNTNSYASAELPGERPGDPIAVRSLLGGTDDPETFASALTLTFGSVPTLTDLEDEADPTCLIGRDALENGKKRPLFLERGLKRALSSLRPVVDSEGTRLGLDHPEHPFNRRRFVYPRDGRDPACLSLRDLVRFYLSEAVLRCEARQRRTVTRLGLSYPANLGPEPRRALNLVIADLERDWKARHPEHASEIAFSRLGPDEASAVALGFILDPEILRKRIVPLFHEQKASFTLAAFDFGGGSIDIALIRFDLKGLPPLTVFSSTLLGLGGDENFGGDNVTVAAYEILGSRIASIVGQKTPVPLASLEVHRHQADLRGWTNRQALWDASEEAKRGACRGEPISSRAEVRGALGRFHADDAAALRAIDAALADDPAKLDIMLDDIYNHTIICDLSGSGRYRVADRIQGCVNILSEFVSRAEADASPKFLILAGAGCRVPLARELLQHAFPKAQIVPEDATIPADYQPKSKVANGLARYLRAVRHTPFHRIQELKSAHLFNHADILWVDSLLADFPIVWARSCVPLNDGEWHVLPGIPLGSAWNNREPMSIAVHRRASPEPELVGVARLGLPADLTVEGVTPRLPDPSLELDNAQVLLRFDDHATQHAGGSEAANHARPREEDYLRIRVRLGDAEFGDWIVHAGSR
jgi:hypothetical protein